jgi:hypothetical protein
MAGLLFLQNLLAAAQAIVSPSRSGPIAAQGGTTRRSDEAESGRGRIWTRPNLDEAESGRGRI